MQNHQKCYPFSSFRLHPSPLRLCTGETFEFSKTHTLSNAPGAPYKPRSKTQSISNTTHPQYSIL